MRPRGLFCWGVSLTIVNFGISAQPLPRGIYPFNAYSSAMGMTVGAVGEDPSSMFWNPASLAIISDLATELTVAGGKADVPETWSLILSNPSGVKESRFGLGLARRHAQESGNNDLHYRTFELLSPLSYHRPGGRLKMGVAVKFASERYSDRTQWASGIKIDLGFLWKWSKGFSVGFSQLNVIGSDLSAYPSKSYLSFALGTPFSPILLTAQTRFDRPRDSAFLSENFGVGIRVRLAGDSFRLMGSFSRQHGTPWGSGGIGWVDEKRNTCLQYAYLARLEKEKEQVHTISYGFRFPSREGRLKVVTGIQRMGKFLYKG